MRNEYTKPALLLISFAATDVLMASDDNELALDDLSAIFNIGL